MSGLDLLDAIISSKNNLIVIGLPNCPYTQNAINEYQCTPIMIPYNKKDAYKFTIASLVNFVNGKNDTKKNTTTLILRFSTEIRIVYIT